LQFSCKNWLIDLGMVNDRSAAMGGPKSGGIRRIWGMWCDHSLRRHH